MSTPGSSYRPLLLLGRGGMGSVEAAAETLGDGTTRIVALKRILRAGGNDAPRVEMFLREARLTTLLEHPNVIRSLAYGETDGELFLAMEYVAGEPLSRVLGVTAEGTAEGAAEGDEHGRHLPLALIAYILAEACEGLHAAHELCGPEGEPLGVVHRDISPQNVMIGYDGTVKLLDFGVAKIDLLDCVARTKTGEVKGKTAYMSPEQAMGDVIDRRSDLYSMGAVLFECVTGRRMWGAGTDLDVLRKLALEEPPRLLDVAPDAPPALAALIARLVERDRTKRPETARELAVALRELATAPEAGVDAAALRAAMSRLFPGEAERREAALASALASGKRVESIVTSLDAARGPGESGPVFVTHHGAIPPHGRLHPGRFASIATVTGATLLSAALGFALFHRAPRGVRETPPAASAAADGKPGSPVAPPHAARPSDRSPEAIAAAESADPADPADSTKRPDHAAPIAVQAHRPPMLRRTLVPHHVAPTPPAPSSAGGSAPAPSSAPAPPAPAPPAPAPAPPDVDPTPF